MSDNPSMKGLLDSIENIEARMRQELESLCRQPRFEEVLQHVHDRYEDALIHLCNYETAVDGHGRSHDMHTVWDQIAKYMRETYQQLTGEEYLSPAMRNVEFRHQRQDERSDQEEK
jgi:hypothetical protein